MTNQFAPIGSNPRPVRYTVQKEVWGKVEWEKTAYSVKELAGLLPNQAKTSAAKIPAFFEVTGTSRLLVFECKIGAKRGAGFIRYYVTPHYGAGVVPNER